MPPAQQAVTEPSSRLWVRRAALLALVLLVLYYLAAQQVSMGRLHADLRASHAAAEQAAEAAKAERTALEEQIADLQEQLDAATEAVTALREQLVRAGLDPVVPAPLDDLED